MKRKEFGFANWDPLQQPAPEPASPQSVDADTYGGCIAQTLGLLLPDLWVLFFVPFAVRHLMHVFGE